MPKKLSEHHLFRLLGGNPQSIILTAPLLDDPLKKIHLVDLYKMLTSNQLCQILQSENIEDRMMASLRLSVQVSVKMIQESDPACMMLFFVLALLPGGVTEQEIQQMEVFMTKLQRVGSTSAEIQRVQNDNELEDESVWKLAKAKLQQNHLIEEVSQDAALDEPDK